MVKILHLAFFWALILCACSPIFPSTQAVTPLLPPITAMPPTVSIAPTEVFPDSPALPIPKMMKTLQTPHIDQPPDGEMTEVSPNPQGCGYQWAYKDLPELSASLLQSLQALEPDTQAVAFGFGEDCIRNDMSRTFIPMETDFNITLHVSDPNDEAVMGEWVVKVMQIIESIPPDQIIGPRPGRVSITFESSGERKGVGFYIDQYRALAPGLSYEDIYRALQTPQ